MMNASIIDPLQGDFPEVIEEYLEHGCMKCIAFNRRGTLLAAGCNDGSCVIWDFETRGISKILHDNECSSPITSICWSKYGHRILVSAADKSLILWDVMSGKKITRIVLQQTPLQARLHPGSSTPSLCLACPLSCAPMIVDLNTGNTTLLKVSVSETSNGLIPPSRNKSSDGITSFTPTAACFNKYGTLVYLGNSKGEILVIDYKIGEVRAVVPITGGSVVKNIVFSRNGQYLLTNSNDRVIRIYENLLPLKDEVRTLDELNENCGDVNNSEKLKAIGSKCLILFREFQDAITKVHWKAPCFSGDGEWVVGGSACKGEHKIYIWDRAGHLVKILEGPKEALIDLAWHPVHPFVVSVSLNGFVYIWAKDYTENWSAFAPDFKELEENEEYVEREDEFDLIPDTEKVKGPDVNEDEEVDIVSVEKDATFSDSDMSQEELCFLPATPSRDPLEQQDKCAESSSKLLDSNNTGSPSEEAGPNGLMMNHASSLLEDDAGRFKRKRKPSEKVLELQAEKVKKSSKSSKLAKPKSKSLVDQDNGNSFHGDGISDE
ncbi:protein RBL-like isoform X2 [Vigna umbellata]|uniref:protein RBL-like isoform X2 n=1 Tax=Vigna umbellata TaxID=87088 RepID=UPI001F5F45B1|nr:protein RBL-like isoform X2 [Vigna umbellata]XP_047180677.1 protein RBL-like isoform X2 [Vigna umbellata]XP_047180678.1 protein RBL-like isoform X2 [Vigna umbellata]